ncbi:Lactate utilization protein B/C [Desulfovibrio sp. X2]|uniref:LutC/YkgG family protein n=1 Tax=Desulfovibrio sp. X2 TaxID=941449 RepID=UPI000358713C|nr:LUD domain-containing protein [Desulfovibrio sp. X2]EPR43369.1 Lactate utilization protein B/C [Desulfovibrio sp. X2]
MNAAESTARENILTRLRRARHAGAPERRAVEPEAAAAALADDREGQAGRVARLEEELKKLTARFVRVTTPREAREAVAALAAEHGAASAVAWDHPLLAALDLPEALAQAGARLLHPREGEEGAACGACGTVACAAEAAVGLTAVDAAIASTGTLVLAAGPGRPRAASLLPPLHVAVVRADQIVAGLDDLPGVLARLRDEDGLPPSGVFCISGPSCTADIELVKVFGVHGPTRLAVVCLDFSA